MAEDVLLYTQNIQESTEEIERVGGRVTQVFTDSVLLARLPEDVAADSLEKSQTEPPAELDETSRLAASGWSLSQSKRRSGFLAETEGLNWDTPGYEPPRHVENDEELAALSEEKKSMIPSAAATTSDYLIGSVAVGIIMVSGTASGLGLTDAERSKIIAEVQEGLNFLANAEPLAGVSFVYDIRHITVSAAPNTSCNSYEACESVWRNPALQQMGVSSVAQYVENLRGSKGTRWAYAAFFTKYKLHHFAYAYSDYLCMEYSNDGWGPDQINKVFAHETGHIFGAADEYGSCGCGNAGYLQVPNNNCVNCGGTQVECLMKGNTLSICQWSRGQIGWDPRLLPGAAGNPSLVQSRFGTKGNFEVIMPLTTTGMAHYWRNNDAGNAWSAGTPFGQSAGQVANASMIQSNYGSPGNLEVVARIGNRLAHFWRGSASPFTWSGAFFFGASTATGNPSLIQGRFGTKGNFELVVPLTTGGMGHYWRNNDSGNTWNGPTAFGQSAGQVAAVSLIQSNYGSPGNLEVVTRIGNRLAHFCRGSASPFTWSGPTFFGASTAAGVPSLIQSRFGTKGNFEVVVPLTTGGMAHYWRNNDSGNTWNGPFPFGQSAGQVAAVSLIQSNYGSPGNLEVVARIGNRLAHFWRDSGPSFTWHGPFFIS